MMKFLRSILFVTILFEFPLQVFAAQEIDLNKGHWQLDAGVGAMFLNAKASAKEGIGKTAWNYKVGLNYVQPSWVTNLSLDFLNYSDNRVFQQTIVNIGTIDHGKIEDSSSSVNGFAVSLATGKAWSIGDTNHFYTQGGYSYIYGSSRHIPSCINCLSEDVNIDGGFFVSAGLIHNFHSFSVGLRDIQYLTGNVLRNNLIFTVGTLF